MAATERSLSLCCHYFIVLFAVSQGFNFDARFSVIKKGPKDSYFGFSVAEHQIVDEVSRELLPKGNVLLIGAPKIDGPRAINVKKSGGVFSCPADSTREDDCKQLINEPFDIVPDSNENMTDQWLGVVVQSQGKGRNVVVCAHRYVWNNNGLGMCYTLLQTLDYQEKWRPCIGRPTEQLHRQFGLCQAGVSSMLAHDDGFIIGAPGSFDWRGVIFKSNVSDVLGTDKQFYVSPVPKEKSTLTVNPTEDPPIDKYGYLGYSVTTGTYDKSLSRYYVSGAPRSSETGEIVLFTQVPGQDLRYAKNQIIKGHRDFSAFGHSLLTINLNGDRFDDLVVGAPFYNSKNVGGAIYVYLGGGNSFNKYTEYVEILSRTMNDVECKALGCEHARFGFSLASAGDVNQDGFQDFAVGAPYEGNGAVYIFHGSDKGVMKKYAQRIDSKDMPAAGLSTFGYSLSGGLDLDGNSYPDLLVGSYGSDQIALLRTRPIIHLISKLTITPKMIDLSKNPRCDNDNTNRHCVVIEMCLGFTAEPKDSFNTRPFVKYRIEAEKSRSIPRVEMKTPKDVNKRIVENTVRLYKQTRSDLKCVTEIAYLKDSFPDKLNPLTFEITYSLEEKAYTRPSPGAPLTDINEYPILATDFEDTDLESTSVTAMVDFHKECGDDNKCDSNLQFAFGLGLPVDKDRVHVLSMGEETVIYLTLNITNLGESAYLTKVYIEKPETLEYQGTETLNATNSETSVKCEPVKNNASLIECEEIGNPLPENHRVDFRIKLDPSNLQPSDKALNLMAWVNTSSIEKTPENDKIHIPFRVIIRADMTLNGISSPDYPITYKGEPRGESAIKIEDEIGPAINHTFSVINFGPGTVSASKLTIYWPYEVNGGPGNGKHLLYLMQSPLVMSGPAECILNPKIINPLGIKENPDFIIRPPRRNTRGGVSEIKSVDSTPLVNPASDVVRKRREIVQVRSKRQDDKNDVTLDCKRNTAKCHVIICSIGELKSDAYVTVLLRGRLWESTLLLDFKSVNEVKIRSRAELYIDPALNIESKQLNTINYAITKAMPDIKDQPGKGIQWWIILVAVLVGVLLLAGLILLLWKLGFFKRKKPEDMQTFKVEVEKKKDLEDDQNF
ncbi:integrin alpha-PS1-like [Gigantopelta aegis]|uniref:integrin alpha-PS1-like n=1 Tax=Gigantopelta aegis TaxID=1735272 RepID=UPI001B88D0F6|nr:integrin alpha-PS1-like [Gigantopelta aegis]